MFRKALLPVLLLMLAILSLAAAAYWYEQKYGEDGPFPNTHHH